MSRITICKSVARSVIVNVRMVARELGLRTAGLCIEDAEPALAWSDIGYNTMGAAGDQN